jgi:hypothetical protein
MLAGNKQKMLIAAIGERAKRLQAPADMPMLRDRATLAQVLTAFWDPVPAGGQRSRCGRGLAACDRRGGPSARGGTERSIL